MDLSKASTARLVHHVPVWQGKVPYGVHKLKFRLQRNAAPLAVIIHARVQFKGSVCTVHLAII